MFTVAMTTLRSARRRGAPRAYLALLLPGLRGSIDRRFVKRRKLNDNRDLLSSPARPGDVFEARRWIWDMDRQRYYGGTVWFGVQAGGSLTRLTRDEAFAAVHAVGVAPPEPRALPAARYPERIMPDDIVCAEEPLECLP